MLPVYPYQSRRPAHSGRRKVIPSVSLPPWYSFRLQSFQEILIGWNTFTALGSQKLSPDTKAATTDQILPLVECELGLAFLPEPMAHEALKQHRVIQIHVREEIPKRQICMVYDRQRPLSAAAKKLKDILMKGSGNF